MFGNRRRRAASNSSLNGSNANPSATTAAAQAFLKNRSSNASLSSAAAAAALRSRPTTPTSVADVQTKRTMRRAGSTSSIGSSGSARPQLERRGSSGSMSERSFRDPSPNRSSQPVPQAADAPPVPAIPQNMQTPAIPAKSHKRAASQEAPPLRVASPPPNKANGRGSSLEPIGMTPSPRRAGPRNPSLSSVSELTSIERPASRGSVHSVNFSLPTGSRPTSPLGHRRLTSPSPQRANPPRITSPTNQNLVYDPNTRSFLPAAEILAIEQRLYDAANKPVKKKKRVAPQQATGTHLADGTIGGRPHGTAVDAMEAASHQAQTPAELPQLAPVSALAPVSEPAPAPAPVPKKKKKKVVVVSDSDSDQASYAPNSSDNDSDARPATFNTRAGALLAKKPSIVREDREREEEEDTTPRRAKVTDGLPRLDTGPANTRPVSPTPLPRSSAGRGHGRGQASASAAFAQGRQQGRSASQPAPAPLGITESIAPAAAKGSVRGSRVQSVSPARTTHFKETTDNLQVKHQPPPRSISPRKSALKNPSTPRGPSPSDNESVGVAQTTSETSEELSVPRKKANRVSFDETNVVVGQAATPVTTDSPLVQSPQQSKKPWYSIGRGKKKDTSAIDDNDDEIMKPRPALPMFGSVRGKKEKPQEEKERPLVRPAEPTESDQPSLFTTPTGEVIEQPLGQSNDHVVGSVLSQDAASKNAANISKSREPLPPQVTSVEGTGYNSETNSSTTSVDVPGSALAAAKIESGSTAPKDGDAEPSLEIPTLIVEEKEESHEGNGAVPEISVLQATPTLEETVSRREWPDMPGGWRNSNSHSDSSSQEREEEIPPVVEHHVTDPTPADVGIAEPDPSTPRAGSPALGDIAGENSHAHPIIVEEPEESDASVYSDAAEDLSDVEGDGFMSLDAVVESPVVPSVSGFNNIPEPDSPTPKATKERAYRQSQLARKTSEPDLDEGWDKAQEYWKGLSADKRRQLEEEARAEAEAEAEGSDTEVEAKPTPKPKKKKKVKTALPPATEPRQVVPQSERSYMIPPGSKAGPNGHAPMTMRSSMRAEPVEAPADTHIRKSMRRPAAKRGSLRAEEPPQPKGALQKKHRPMSYPPNEFQPDQAVVDDLVRKMSKAGAGAAPAAAKKTTTASTQRPSPTLRRRGSGDSDSSFKRSRSGSNSNEIPNFRRSMRGSMETNNSGRHESPVGSSRFSLRSLSPTGSTMRRPFSHGGSTAANSAPTHMRMSMRNSGSYGPTPTMRGNPSVSRAKSPLRIPGFGRSASAKPSKQNLKPKKSSRFADSSDEEDNAPAFRSRFVDSSDEEDEPLPPRQSGMAAKSMRASAPVTSTPVRGIPKRAGAEDGDSSDLPDSDDEKPKSPRPKTPQNGTAQNQSSLRRSGSGRGTISPTTTTTISGPSGGRPTHARRGSIMSILRRKKPEPGSKVRKSEIESAARRDTPLERSKSDLAAVRRPQSPKLQKRNPMSRENSASWPLPIPDSPSKVVGGEDGRPFSADAGNGVVGSESKERERPDMGNRRFTATGLSGVDINGVLPEGGRRKKKFGALRRMFRLDD